MKQEEREMLALLKGVSRSFYVSLRLLPGPMRRGAAIGYLLARASDTLADAEEVPLAVRMEALAGFRAGLVAGGAGMPDCCAYEGCVRNPDEWILLGRMADVVRAYVGLPDAERRLVLDVLETIVGGQQWDLERFGNARAGHPVALESREELDGYTYRVAGCVGEFWTKLGYLTMGSDFSRADPQVMCELGRDYGKGLQLVNILRDVVADGNAGRCYLPVEDFTDRAGVLLEHRYWMQMAYAWVARGVEYRSRLESRRLRVASGLPAEIAIETLDLLAVADWEALAARVKVPRRAVYGALVRGLVMG